ncbi:MAG: RluA family pseudouridine synthase [Chitinophagaceae bacterium]|nr:RluA family pseudouridine synthase [Chitinophagaceae bacterium]
MNNWKDFIIFENENFVVINKPPFIASIPERNKKEVSMLEIGREYFLDLQAAHRIDKVTSGILVFTKNNESYKHIAGQFERREVKKIYHAVVNGIHKFEKKKVDIPLLIHSNGFVQMSKEGKSSITILQTLYAYKFHTLLECEPITGRLHQIRIHCAASEAPICGDSLYGGQDCLLSQIKKRYKSSPDEEEKPLIRRTALHASKITFMDRDGEEINVEAPYPKDFKALIYQLEKYA